MRILGFGAHPDDVEIFFLGLMLAFRAAGHEIGWAIATDGAKGGPEPGDALARLRAEEAAAAAAPFGVTPTMLGRPDGGLPGDAAIAGLIAETIERTGPDLIVTHPANDYHPDHRMVSRTVQDAAGFRVPVLFADTLMGKGSVPTHYVDITDHFEAKVGAIRAHRSQRPERFVESARVWNRFRALQCNAPDRYAEAFRFEPVYPFADIRGLLPPAPSVMPLGRAGLPPARF
jgi:LmbE family N-acetylglucosaminyl deacetylase